MNRKIVLAVVAALAVAALAWDRRGGPSAPTQAAVQAPVAAASVSSAQAALAPPSVAAAGPGGMKSAPNFLRPASVTYDPSTALSREFSGATTFKPLYDRLKGTPEGETPEGQFLMYRILRACATVADRKGGGAMRSQNAAQMEERRQVIASELPESDPRRAQRLAALDKVATDQCAGLSGITVTEAELGSMLRNAVAGGDPKARAWQVEQEMWQERRATGQAARGGPTLSDPQVAALRDAFASRDPEAMVIAGRVLSSSFRDVSVRIGPEQEALEHRAFANAALLLACEYGYPCGENNSRVLAACAFQGHCGVASLPDYLFYYGSSPYDAQVLDRYRNVLRQAIDSRDWSSLTVQRGSRSPNAPR